MPRFHSSILSSLISIALISLSSGANAEKADLNLRDWFAFGSGCLGAAKHPERGNVRIDFVRDASDPLVFHVSFDLSSYKLSGSQAVGDKTTFARECALRIAAHPSAGHRIADVALSTTLRVKKSRGVSAKMRARLVTGSADLAEWRRDYPAMKAIRNHQHRVDLRPDAKGQRHMAGIGCGRAKVLGADLQLKNVKESFAPRIEMGMGASREARLSIRLEPCAQERLAQH